MYWLFMHDSKYIFSQMTIARPQLENYETQKSEAFDVSSENIWNTLQQDSIPVGCVLPVCHPPIWWLPLAVSIGATHLRTYPSPRHTHSMDTPTPP